LARLAGPTLLVVVTVSLLLRTPPGNIEREFPYAVTALEHRDLARVELAISRLERHGGYDSHVRLLRGALFMHHGAEESALEEFGRSTPQGDVRKLTLLLTAECLYRLNRLTEAESLMRQLAAEHPEDPDPHRWLGAIYYDFGANDDAIRELERVITIAPQDYRPYRLIGLMRMDFAQYQEAIPFYRLALARSPPSPVREEVLRELGRCLIAVRDFIAAQEVLQQAQPVAVALVGLAECHWSLGNTDQAHQLLSQARALDPHDRDVLYFEARLEMDAGRPDRAAASLEAILEQDPYDLNARYQLALAWQRAGDDDRHSTELARWQELNRLHQELTRLSADAIRDPHAAGLRDQLADVCADLGKVELAASWRRAAEALRNDEIQRGSPTHDGAVAEDLGTGLPAVQSR
jgi:tetratricopeptide (TPR) repeat protein